VEAAEEARWQELATLYRAGETIDGIVIRANVGGLIVDNGAHAFLPAGLIETALERVEDLDRYVGRQVAVKIIELHAPSRNLVVSRRAVLEST